MRKKGNRTHTYNNISRRHIMNYYNDIKTKLIENENYAKIKDYSKERYKLNTYYEVGRILSEAGKHYGNNIIGEYSLKLQEEVGKKYN